MSIVRMGLCSRFPTHRTIRPQTISSFGQKLINVHSQRSLSSVNRPLSRVGRGAEMGSLTDLVIRSPRIGGIYHHLKPRSRYYSSTTKAQAGKQLGKVLIFGLLSIFIGYGLGSAQARLLPSARTKRDLDEEAERIPEYKWIHNHPLVKELRKDPELVESRFYDQILIDHQENMVTSGILAGDGLITVEPLVFTDKSGQIFYAFYHIGDRLHGHPGAIHSGLLATLMDEGLAACGFPSLPGKYGVTANLSMDFLAPVPVNSYLVLKARTVQVKGRKVTVEGQFETLTEDHDASEKPTVLVRGRMILVEPKWAKFVSWMF